MDEKEVEWWCDDSMSGRGVGVLASGRGRKMKGGSAIIWRVEGASRVTLEFCGCVLTHCYECKDEREDAGFLYSWQAYFRCKQCSLKGRAKQTGEWGWGVCGCVCGWMMGGGGSSLTWNQLQAGHWCTIDTILFRSARQHHNSTQQCAVTQMCVSTSMMNDNEKDE